MSPGLDTVILQVAGLRGMEWLIVIGLIVAVFFGTKKIPELARSFGKATAEFEKARIEGKRELQQLEKEVNSNNDNSAREKLESVADTLGIDYSNKNNDELRAAIELELNNDKK